MCAPYRGVAHRVSPHRGLPRAIDSSASPVWFITGCSTGFGREIAQAVLARGWRGVVTARDPGTVADLASAHSERALSLKLDVTSPEAVGPAVAQAKASVGRIDVLVNNAGK